MNDNKANPWLNTQYTTVAMNYFLILQIKEHMFFVKGALERILNNCSKFYNRGHLASLTEKWKQEYIHQASMMGQSGLRGKKFIIMA